MSGILYFHLALEVLTLLVAGYSDFRTREIDDKVWMMGAAALTPFIIYELYTGMVSTFLYAFSVILGLLMAAVLWYSGAMGEADAIEIAFISLFTPPTRFSICVFPIVSVIVDSTPFIALYAAYNFILNYSRLHGRDAFKGYRVSSVEKLLAYFSLRYVDPEEYREKSYMYAPATVEEDGVKKLRFTLVLPERKGVEGGWVVVYLPQVALLAAGFALYVLLLVEGRGGCILDLFL